MLLQSLLDKPKRTYINWYCFWLFQSLGLLYLESFSVVFKEVFLSDGTSISMSLQVLFLWSLITIIRLVSRYFSICVYLHISKYRSFLIFSDRPWFTFIPLVRHLDIVVLTCFPMYMYICSCLVVSLNILSFCKFRTARHNVVYRFLVSVAYPAHWISAVFYNSSMV